jgi:hypothetical protein
MTETLNLQELNKDLEKRMIYSNEDEEKTYNDKVNAIKNTYDYERFGNLSPEKLEQIRELNKTKYLDIRKQFMNDEGKDEGFDSIVSKLQIINSKIEKNNEQIDQETRRITNPQFFPKMNLFRNKDPDQSEETRKIKKQSYFQKMLFGNNDPAQSPTIVELTINNAELKNIKDKIEELKDAYESTQTA